MRLSAFRNQQDVVGMVMVDNSSEYQHRLTKHDSSCSIKNDYENRTINYFSRNVKND